MVDIRNVFVIISKGYDREQVEKAIREDGYQHNFIFNDRFGEGGWGMSGDDTEWKKAMEQCDEVWVYGEPHRTFTKSKWQYSHALKENMEIWKMG